MVADKIWGRGNNDDALKHVTLYLYVYLLKNINIVGISHVL